MQKPLLKKGIAAAVIILFIGMGVIPSTGNIVEDVFANTQHLDVVDSSEELLFCGTIVYSFWLRGPLGTGFYAWGPGNITRFRKWEGDGFFSAGTWTKDGRFLCCMYSNGTLYEVDPKTLDAWAIGNSGTSLNGLSSDPTTGKLYGASRYDLYEINITTGEQTYIGAFGTGTIMISIAHDQEGTLYGWDLESNARLWIIDPEDASCEEVGSLGIYLNYAQDGHFCFEDDYLYLSAFTISPGHGGYLYRVNKTSGEAEMIGMFEGGNNPTAFAISYELNMMPPVTNISFNPLYPNGDNGWYVSNVTVILNATDNTGVIDTYYRINGGEWETYDSPFVISEDGEYTIEYYSYDYVGIIEDVKSETIDIDQTPPETSLEWEAFKESWKWYVRFILNATDETSGMAPWVVFYINDALQGEFEVNWPTFELIIQWSKSFKSCSFKFECFDNAGNSAFELVNGSDIKSYSSSQSSTQQTQNMWFLRWLDRFPLLLQRLLGWFIW